MKTAGKRQLHCAKRVGVTVFWGEVMLFLHGVRVVVVRMLSGLKLTQLQVRWDVIVPALCVLSPSSCR